VLRFATSTTAAVPLVLPLPRPLTSFDAPLHILAGRGGVGIAALAGLLVSEYTSLFGFTESGFRATIVLEAAATLLLGALVSTPLARVEVRERGVDVIPLRRAA
jgi:hypothetical protein